MSAHTSITLWDIVKRLLQSFFVGRKTKDKSREFLKPLFSSMIQVMFAFPAKDTRPTASDVRCLQVSLTEPFRCTIKRLVNWFQKITPPPSKTLLEKIYDKGMKGLIFLFLSLPFR